MVLIQLLLPVTAAATSEQSPTPLALTRRELTARFSGLTAYVRSPAQGIWTAPDGQQEKDEVVMFEIVTETFDRAWWRPYAATLAQRFQQDAIHIRALPIQMLDEEAS